ncbi:MAG: response regulator transcription factor [Nibricoccus sp.]
MNILVVDDDPVAQRIMKMFLERSGYNPTILVDGPKGLEAALRADAPPIILLDWMLPGMDGVTVCRKIREAKPKVRPYVIMLSAKHGKEDIAAGLDAGADDFVSKPFNVAEMQARLRVARRMIEYQRQLVKQIEDNEALMQRNSLLGELMSKRQDGGATNPGLPDAKPAASSRLSARDARKPTELGDHEVRYMLSIALLELRLALQGVTPRSRAPEFRNSNFSAWAGLLMPEHDTWMDVILVGDEHPTEELFQRSLGRVPQNEAEIISFMAELARMVAMGINRTLRVRVGEVVQPLMTQAMRYTVASQPIPLPEVARSYDLMIENLPFRAMMAIDNCPKRMVAPAAVHTLDILAGPFPPPEVSLVPMFNEGVVLTPRFIEKMLTHDVAAYHGECASIRRLTRVARYFQG